MKNIYLHTIYLVLIFTLLCKIAYTQEKGYIVIDGELKQGYIIARTEKKNLKECLFKENKIAQVDTLTPIQISEYALYGEKKVYLSHKILLKDNTEKQLFLPINIYSEDTILSYSDNSDEYNFILVNDALFPISKSELNFIIKSNRKNNSKEFSKSLSLDLYGGINIGNIEAERSSATGIYTTYKTEPIPISDINYIFGLNLNIPIKVNWRINLGFGIGSHNFNLDERIENVNYEFASDFIALNIPLQVNYIFFIDRFSITPKFGGIFTLRSFKENYYYKGIIVLSNEVIKPATIGIIHGIEISYKRFYLMYNGIIYAENNLKYVENQITLGIKLL